MVNTVSKHQACIALASLALLAGACGGTSAQQPTVSVAIAPKSLSLQVGGSGTFSAAVAGPTDTSVTWSVAEGAAGGTVTDTGVYTAPTLAGTYHVVVTSNADPTKSDSATVTVLPRPPVVVTVSPHTATVQSSHSVSFTAAVTGSSNTAVVWTVQEGAAGGSITSGGVYTAPASVGTYHVVATSNADSTKSDAATVTVTAQPVVAVTVSPHSAALQTGQSATFSATVTGSSNTAVVWTVQEGAAGGSVTSGGVYTAPASAGAYRVVATSSADSTKSDAATVTVTAPALTVTPASVSVIVNATQQFTSSAGATWSLDEASGCGAVSGTGLYTAPAAVPNPATCHVTATALAGGGKASAVVTVLPASGYLTPSPLPSHDVAVSSNTEVVSAVSPYVFGLNDTAGWGTGARYVTTFRLGGNRLTGYNWENNYSNAGADFWGANDNQLNNNSDGPPGAAVRLRADATYGRTGTWANAFLYQVPLAGYVSGKWTAVQSGVQNAPIPVAADRNTPAVPALTGTNRWYTSLPARPGDTGHAQATSNPSLTDDFVYQDDFFKWLDATYPGHKSSATEPLFLQLDGEPDFWGGAHPEIRGRVTAAGGTCTTPPCNVNTGYQEYLDKSVAMAKSIRDMLGTGVKIIGADLGSYTALISLGNQVANGDGAPAPTGYNWWIEQYLDLMKQASATDGRRLLDAIDVHWYGTNVTYPTWAQSGTDGVVIDDGKAQTTNMIDAREQYPRTFWDPSYLEASWITYWGVVKPMTPATGVTALCDGFGPGGWNAGHGCGLQLVPRLRQIIDRFYPGTRVVVAEWWHGRGQDISGAIAAADTLGVFAREGVFEASMWPAGSGLSCSLAAFNAFLNYDGAGARIGDTYASTTIDDPNRPAWTAMNAGTLGNGQTPFPQTLERVTAYTTLDGGLPNRAVIVAINKSQTAALNTGFQVRHTVAFTKAEVYRLTGSVGACSGPTRQSDVPITLVNAFVTSLPAQSVTVFVLKP